MPLEAEAGGTSLGLFVYTLHTSRHFVLFSDMPARFRGPALLLALGIASSEMAVPGMVFVPAFLARIGEIAASLLGLPAALTMLANGLVEFGFSFFQGSSGTCLDYPRVQRCARSYVRVVQFVKLVLTNRILIRRLA